MLFEFFSKILIFINKKKEFRKKVESFDWIFLKNFEIYFFFLKKFVKKVESFDWIFLKNFEINFF